MANDVHTQTRRDRGFTLLEVLVVVAIVAIMAATAFPAIGSYVRNYRIKGATQQVAGDVQAARSKAIMANTNAGVTFVAVDQNSYRWIHEDLAFPEGLGPLHDLPVGITFEPSGTASAGPYVRFQRLGGFCNPTAGPPCAVPPPTVCDVPEVGPRCNLAPLANYIGTEAGGGMVITLLEQNTQLRRRVRIAPGGRVLIQEGQP